MTSENTPSKKDFASVLIVKRMLVWSQSEQAKEAFSSAHFLQANEKKKQAVGYSSIDTTDESTVKKAMEDERGDRYWKPACI